MIIQHIFLDHNTVVLVVIVSSCCFLERYNEAGRADASSFKSLSGQH